MQQERLQSFMIMSVESDILSNVDNWKLFYKAFTMLLREDGICIDNLTILV